MSKLNFKVIIESNGEEVHAHCLSYEEISNLVSNAPDHESCERLYYWAAQHPATSVRENVAYKDKLSSEIVEILSKDSSIPILRYIVKNANFKDTASLDKIQRLIELDIEIATSIAGDLETYSEAGSLALAKILAEHPDPAVPFALAGNYRAPKKVLEQLLEHPDSQVAREAKRSLDN